MAAPEDFDRVGDLLGGFCEAAASSAPLETDSEQGQRPGQSRARTARGGDARAFARVWPEIAGAEVAANASPVQLKEGRLVVSTSSSVWAHTLQYMAEDLSARLNERLGAGTVQKIVFRHAGWEERPRGEAPVYHGTEGNEAGQLSQDQTEALAELADLDLPPAIRATVERAMRASFARIQRDSVR